MAKKIEPDDEDNDSGWSSSDDYEDESHPLWFDEDYDVDEEELR